MDEKTMAGQVGDRTSRACRIARGEETLPPDAEGRSIRGGYKNLSCSGRGPWWFRMVWRGGQWQYFSDERLPAGTLRASERRASVEGEVYLGELVCQHDRGKPVDAAYLVCEPDEDDTVLVAVEYRRRRDGHLSVELPDGTTVVVPDPRAK